MKIAVLSSSEVPSSTANSIQTMKTCQALAQAGHDVRLWVPGGTVVDWDWLTDHYGLSTKFDVRWLNTPTLLKRYDFTLRAMWEARAWGEDILYTWMLQAASLGLFVKVPVILELHMLPTGRIGPFLLRYCVKAKSDKRFLIITKALKALLEETQGVCFDGDIVQIAPMGSEPERYKNIEDMAYARRTLGLPDGILVGYTGHLYAGRGMEVLQALASAFPEVHFLWVGGRPEDVSFWKGRLEDAGIVNVILTGFVENSKIPLYQSAADVLLMPYGRSVAVSSGGDTVDVCSPMKMFEYMTAGRAIMSSDLPVLHEVLNDENALFCPPDDPDAWVQSLAKLLSDTERRGQLGAKARQDAQAYSWLARARRSLDGFQKVKK